MLGAERVEKTSKMRVLEGEITQNALYAPELLKFEHSSPQVVRHRYISREPRIELI
jgi:hypothetical protein